MVGRESRNVPCVGENHGFGDNVAAPEDMHGHPIGRVHEEAKILVRELRERVVISHRLVLVQQVQSRY